MANTGPSARMFRFGSVTTAATSMMRSLSGSSPVISMSIQTRLNSFGRCGGVVAWVSVVSIACDIIRSWLRLLANLVFSHRHSMLSFGFSVLFVIFFVLTLALRYWLASRHIRHVLRHRERVPDEFAEKIPLDAHQKAADYTVAKTRFGLLHAIWSGVVLIGFTLMGGLQALSTALLHLLGPGMAYQILLVVGFAAISGLLDLPFTYWFQFVLEQRFGFNKMTVKLWLADMVKGTLIGAAIGLPLLWLVLTLMDRTGSLWWLYTWVVW